MAPRIKWSGPKKALMLKQEPGAKDDLKNDPTYNPKAFRLSRVKDSKSRITKRSQSAQTPHIKREPRSVTPSAINKPNANVSYRRRMKDADDLEIRMKDNNIHYEIRMFAKPTDRVGALINVWKERRRGLSDPRFLLNDERILNEDSTLQNVCHRTYVFVLRD